MAAARSDWSFWMRVFTAFSSSSFLWLISSIFVLQRNTEKVKIMFMFNLNRNINIIDQNYSVKEQQFVMFVMKMCEKLEFI